MAIVYSTEDVHPRDRATYWREVVIKDFVRHEFHSSVGQAFRGGLSIGMLGNVGVAVFNCDPCRVGRTERDLAHCRSDDFLLYLQVAGRSVVACTGRESVLKPGSIVLFDTLRTNAALHQTAVDCLTLTIPRQELEARIGNVAALAGQPFPPGNTFGGLMFNYLDLLPERLDTIGGATGAKLSEHVLDLIALSFTDGFAQDGVTLSSPRRVALHRLKSVIESNLCDPELKPATAAAAASMSVRYANALLAQEDTSIERYIMHRRLERCRRALEDPTQSHRMIGEIAFSWGFSDLSHFGRRFRSAYGLSPGDYRRSVREQAAPCEGDAAPDASRSLVMSMRSRGN